LGQVLIGVLAVLWLLVLAPPLLRARAAHRHSGDLSDYCRSLSKLGRHQRRTATAFAAPTAAVALSPRARAARRRAALRRRRVFAWLGGSLGATFVLAALSSSRSMWLLCGVCLAALLSYTALVAHFQRRDTQPVMPLARPVRLSNVAYLRVPVAPADPTRQLALRRTVNS
jgi:hypothetical protein